MRRSKEIWYLLLFSLLIAAVAGLIMTVGRKEEKNSYTVSVIVNNNINRHIRIHGSRHFTGIFIKMIDHFRNKCIILIIDTDTDPDAGDLSSTCISTA